MRITTSRTAKFAAAVAAAGLLTVGCGDNSPSVGDLTASAKSAADSAASKGKEAGESAKSKAESATNGSDSSGASASGENGGAGGSGDSTQINSPDGQPVTVKGDILSKYNDAGGENGKLGAPVAEPQSGPNGGTCQEFVGGMICDSDSTDAQVVWGEMRKAWEADGGLNSSLGYPTDDEKLDNGTYSQEFQHGSISWSGGEPKITKK